MADVGEPVDVSATVVEGVDELVGDHPAHVGLAADVILAQDNQPECFIASSSSLT